jgi:hypothetical protein
LDKLRRAEGAAMPSPQAALSQNPADTARAVQAAGRRRTGKYESAPEDPSTLYRKLIETRRAEAEERAAHDEGLIETLDDPACEPDFDLSSLDKLEEEERLAEVERVVELSRSLAFRLPLGVVRRNDATLQGMLDPRAFTFSEIEVVDLLGSRRIVPLRFALSRHGFTPALVPPFATYDDSLIDQKLGRALSDWDKQTQEETLRHALYQDDWQNPHFELFAYLPTGWRLLVRVMELRRMACGYLTPRHRASADWFEPAFWPDRHWPYTAEFANLALRIVACLDIFREAQKPTPELSLREVNFEASFYEGFVPADLSYDVLTDFTRRDTMEGLSEVCSELGDPTDFLSASPADKERIMHIGQRNPPK